MAALPDAKDFRRYWDKDHELNEAEAEACMALLIGRRRQLFD
jgi:hypothetical protein